MTSLKLDFGEGTLAEGYLGINSSTEFSPDRGFGWVSSSLLETRDRNVPDRLLGRFVQGNGPATLRLAVDPGRYCLRLLMGDKDYGNHSLELQTENIDGVYPLLTAEANEYTVLQTVIDVPANVLDLTFNSSGINWILNSLTLQPSKEPSGVAPQVVHCGFDDPALAWVDDESLLVSATTADLSTGSGPVDTLAPDGNGVANPAADKSARLIDDGDKEELQIARQSHGLYRSTKPTQARQSTTGGQQKHGHPGDQGATGKLIRTIGSWFGI